MSILRLERTRTTVSAMRIAIALLLSAAACGASSSITVAPDGGYAYQVVCRDPVDCMGELAELCPAGHFVLNAGNQTTGYVAQTYGSGYSAVTVARPVGRFVVVARCRRGKKAAAE